MSFDPRDLRNELGRFTTGVCVITTTTDEGVSLGMTANSFSSVSLDPALVLWNLQNNSDVYEAFAQPRYFAVSVLAQEQQELSNEYAKKGEHIMREADFEPGVQGSPVIKNALVTFECELETTYPGGDHLIVLGRVLNMVSRDGGEPLVFFSGSYRQLG